MGTVSKLIHRAMCDVCGEVRDYAGKYSSSSLKCEPCGRRTHHHVVGEETWADMTLRHGRSRGDAALLLLYEDLLSRVGVDVSVSGERWELDTSSFYCLSLYLDGPRLERLHLVLHADITLEGRVYAYAKTLHDLSRIDAGDVERGGTFFSMRLAQLSVWERSRFLVDRGLLDHVGR